MNKFNFFLTVSIFTIYAAFYKVLAQVDLSSDPLLKYKIYTEQGITVNRTLISPNQSIFNTSKGTYTFNVKEVYPTADLNFNVGFIFKNKKNNDVSLNTIKTGINLLYRNANFSDSLKTNFTITTNYLQIPVLYGIRKPLKYNTVKNNLFRATETNIGFYAATPLVQSKVNTDSPNGNDLNFILFNYLRFGFIGEVMFTALNTNGNGHKLGIRATIDADGLIKFKDTPKQLYPSYYSLGLFYCLFNDFK